MLEVEDKNFVKWVKGSTQKAKRHKKAKRPKGIIHLIILNENDPDIMSNVYYFLQPKSDEKPFPKALLMLQ